MPKKEYKEKHGNTNIDYHLHEKRQINSFSQILIASTFRIRSSRLDLIYIFTPLNLITYIILPNYLNLINSINASLRQLTTIARKTKTKKIP